MDITPFSKTLVMFMSGSVPKIMTCFDSLTKETRKNLMNLVVLRHSFLSCFSRQIGG